MEKLTIKNFGPIKEASLDLKRRNVFIGPQASGKSTIAKLVAIFREPGFLLDGNNDLKFYKDLRIDGFFKKDTVINYQSEQYNYDIEVRNEPLIHNININSHFKTTILSIKNDLESATNQLAQSDKRDLDSLRELHRQRSNQLQGMRYLTSSNPLYIPTERFLISTVADSSFNFSDPNSLPEYLTNFGKIFQLIRNNALNSFTSNILNVEYRFEGGRDKVYINESEYVFLADSASGYQALLPTEIIISYLTEAGHPKTFIIEEPELNLFPETQKRFIYYLLNKCRANDDLFLTTHSPYILSSLNTLLFAWKVANKFPERIEEIDAIIPIKSWINPDEFSAYYVGDGTVKSIIDDSTGMIGENLLDGISEDLAGEFDALMSIYKRKKAA